MVTIGRKNHKGLIDQAHEVFESIKCFGTSKHEDKLMAAAAYEQLPEEKKQSISKQDYINETLRNRIYSYNSYETYAKHNTYFLKWVKENYHCRVLAQCKEYVNEWLQLRMDEGKSAYTIDTEKAGLAKLFQCSSKEFIDTPKRSREHITRSRGRSTMDYGFSLKNNAEIINFCRSTGLRRSELASLKPEQLKQVGDNYYLIIEGKGGRIREAPIIGGDIDMVVGKIKGTPEGEKVWQKIPSHMDVHSYRSDYATALYKAYERNMNDIPMSEKYYCRADRKGIVFDKKAMAYVTEALGHSRLEVIARHYIR